MISTEQAFDMLPAVVDLWDKLEIDEYRKKLVEENKNKPVDKVSAGISAVKFILKNSGKVKNEVFEIVAILEDKTIEEVKAQSFISTMNSLKELLSDEEAMTFFKDAVL